jgi:hypothetical protein
MIHRLTHIAPLSAAKIAALLCLLVSLPVTAVNLLPLMDPANGPRLRLMSGSLLALPLVYAATGFVAALMGAWIYNLLAGLMGGIELTLTPLAERRPLAVDPDPSELDTLPAAAM